MWLALDASGKKSWKGSRGLLHWKLAPLYSSAVQALPRLATTFDARRSCVGALAVFFKLWVDSPDFQLQPPAPFSLTEQPSSIRLSLSNSGNNFSGWVTTTGASQVATIANGDSEVSPLSFSLERFGDDVELLMKVSV